MPRDGFVKIKDSGVFVRYIVQDYKKTEHAMSLSISKNTFFKTSVFLCLLAAFAAGAVFFYKSRPVDDGYKWYEKVLMYHVLVKSFYDSNGDGKGDLKGLTEKLDYIKELGVNTIYMLPITPSLNVQEMPRSHYGYEITEFKDIHPDYGTLDDFKTLVKEAHKRGLHIVLDFITTVISVRHPFFQDVLNNPNSKYKDWFITSPEPKEGEWMNFNDYSEQFKSSAWNPLPHGGYYYSLWGKSPFLNYHNPEVREYIMSVIDFWLDTGADGFRIDATKHLFINGPGEAKQYHQPENFEFWKNLRKHITQKYGPDKTLIAEVVPIPAYVQYVAPNREMFDSMFDSTFISDVYPFTATNLDNLYSASYLHSFFDNETIYKTTKLKDRLTYHSDHDGVRLAARLLPSEPERLKLAAAILLLTPSHVKLYAGDEIGIKGFSDFKDEKNKWFHATVASMAWDNTKNGGFSTSDNPVIPITDDFATNNVADQEKDEESLLNFYRRLTKLKNGYARLFFKGDRFSYKTNSEEVYSYFLSNGNEAALVVMNLGSRIKDFSADLAPYHAGKEKIIFSHPKKPQIKRDGDVLSLSSLSPHGVYVLYFDRFDASALQKADPAKMKKIALNADGTEIVSDETALYTPVFSQESARLKLFKGQGKIPVLFYEKDDTDSYVLKYSSNIDTNAKDVLLPLQRHRADAFVLRKGGIRFSLENEAAQTVFEGKLKPVFASNDNVNLKQFFAGQDENFWYFKVDRDAYVLPANGGLDYAFLFNNGQTSKGTNKIGFWRLPNIRSSLTVDGILLYERHIKQPRLQTNISGLRYFGVNIPDKIFFIETPNEAFFMVSKEAMPLNRYQVALIVWSARGRWGEKPPEGPLPIVERLPDDAKKTRSDTVTSYLTVE